MLAKLIALIAREIVTEYRKLDAGPEVAGEPDVTSPAELSCVTATFERATGWDHDTRAPVTAQVPTGFVSRTRLAAHLPQRPEELPGE
jgi:hypothetical protein